MNISRKKFFSYFIIALCVASLSSCVKKDFDQPPTGGVDPVMTGTQITISALKAMYTGTPVKITTDVYIVGSVIADDQSGNFYKELVLQDSTGGISVVIDQSNYYTTYKIGRRVFVKCNGLTLGAYSNLIQLGAGVDNTGSLLRISQTLVPDYVLPGSYYHYVTPKTIHISDITTANLDSYIDMLVKIDSVEFVEQDTTFADAVDKIDQNLNIEDCGGKTLVIRSSGYANFASIDVPTGNGSLIAVMQIYNSSGSNAVTDLQLKIRDLSDLNMTLPRCGSGGGGTVGTGSLMTIGSVRALYPGVSAIFAAGTKIRGTVISDVSTGNITSNNLVMQDGASGIVVRFTSPNTFALNDSIEVDLSGNTLTAFSGLLEIDNANLSSVTLKGSGNVIPLVVTNSQVNANLSSWESTLLQITNVTLSGGTGGTYSGNVTLTDATGTLELYTRSQATFAGTSLPTGTHTVTGYLSQYLGTPELTIRNTADVQ